VSSCSTTTPGISFVTLIRLYQRRMSSLRTRLPGVIELLGFSYEIVATLNPRIVYAQIKGHGAGSPYERYLSF
jgi:hypothetical protein